MREALTEFFRAVEHKDDVSAALKRVVQLQNELAPSTHPMLRHYLERRSYQKALDFLNTGTAETEKPQCAQPTKKEES